EGARYTDAEAYFIYIGQSTKTNLDPDTKYIKMHAKKIYQFALTHVTDAMKSCLDTSAIDIVDVKTLLLHQAKERLDEAIMTGFYSLYQKEAPENVMAMSIYKVGNSSVARVPTLFDLILKDEIETHEIKKGDIIIFASVGAGMHINSIVYRY